MAFTMLIATAVALVNEAGRMRTKTEISRNGIGRAERF